MVRALASQLEGPGFDSRTVWAFLCGVRVFSLCLRRFPPGTPVSPTTKNMYNRPGCLRVCMGDDGWKLAQGYNPVWLVH